MTIIRWNPPADGDARMVRVERWDFDLARCCFEETHGQDLRLGE